MRYQKSGFFTAAMAIFSTFAACFRGTLRIVFEATAALLAAFATCLGSLLLIISKITGTTTLLSHNIVLTLG